MGFWSRSDLAFIGGYHGLVDLRVGEIARIRASDRFRGPDSTLLACILLTFKFRKRFIKQ